MSEFGFIGRIAAACASLPDHGFEGIGDDCAVLPVGDGEALVFTADLLVEGVHFLRHTASPAELGGKALAVNLSDVASMGAVPVATLLSIALPADARDDWAERFMEGYHDASARYGVALVGGDTTSSLRDIAVNVTAIGRVPLDRIKRRSAARAGDLIFVTGELGLSGAGLRDLLRGAADTPFAVRHRNPVPRVGEGVWLGMRPEVHAMMDLSDGLASDLRHILRASQVGAAVETTAIPTPVDLDTALCGGEDYELLLTAEASAAEPLQAAFAARFGRPLHCVGRITSSAGTLQWLRHGTPLTADWQGFRHW